MRNEAKKLHSASKICSNLQIVTKLTSVNRFSQDGDVPDCRTDHALAALLCRDNQESLTESTSSSSSSSSLSLPSSSSSSDKRDKICHFEVSICFDNQRTMKIFDNILRYKKEIQLWRCKIQGNTGINNGEDVRYRAIQVEM